MSLKAIGFTRAQHSQAPPMAPPELLALLALLLLITHLLTKNRKLSKRLPPGSLGIPIIGQSLGLLRAMRTNTGEEWIQKRIKKYGPISKLSLFGRPAVFLTGPAANKFIFSSDSLAPKQPESISRIIGARNMLELIGKDHKRVRGAVSYFLKAEVLRKSVGKIDEEIRHHLRTNWSGHNQVKVMPSMKSLTFNVICSTLFGMERGARREVLVQEFIKVMAGMWSVPINLPLTNFNKSLKASGRIREVLTEVLDEKRCALKRGECSSDEDLITYLLSLGANNGEALTEDEILDNAVLVMIAGHDTTSILLTFIARQLANDPAIYAAVLNEQEEIAKGKAPGEALTWDDLVKMKYTWRVAQEILRTIPPVFGGFRRVIKDVEFGGYLIPKGWQVFWNTSITHMDENIFREPENFNPDRFENQSMIPPYCFIAFGAGPRICPGYEFAKTEALVGVHYMVTRFKWKLCCKDDTFVRDPMPSPKQGLPVLIEIKDSL